MPAGTDREDFHFRAKEAGPVGGLPKQLPKVSRSVQEDYGWGLGRTEVTPSPPARHEGRLLQVKPAFVRADRSPVPFLMAVVATLPANVFSGEDDQDQYKREVRPL